MWENLNYCQLNLTDQFYLSLNLNSNLELMNQKETVLPELMENEQWNSRDF